MYEFSLKMVKMFVMNSRPICGQCGEYCRVRVLSMHQSATVVIVLGWIWEMTGKKCRNHKITSNGSEADGIAFKMFSTLRVSLNGKMDEEWCFHIKHAIEMSVLNICITTEIKLGSNTNCCHFQLHSNGSLISTVFRRNNCSLIRLISGASPCNWTIHVWE